MDTVDAICLATFSVSVVVFLGSCRWTAHLRRASANATAPSADARRRIDRLARLADVATVIGIAAYFANQAHHRDYAEALARAVRAVGP